MRNNGAKHGEEAKPERTSVGVGFFLWGLEKRCKYPILMSLMSSE